LRTFPDAVKYSIVLHTFKIQGVAVKFLNLRGQGLLIVLKFDQLFLINTCVCQEIFVGRLTEGVDLPRGRRMDPISRSLLGRAAAAPGDYPCKAFPLVRRCKNICETIGLAAAGAPFPLVPQFLPGNVIAARVLLKKVPGSRFKVQS
jgi:hypothetical protein